MRGIEPNLLIESIRLVLNQERKDEKIDRIVFHESGKEGCKDWQELVNP